MEDKITIGEIINYHGLKGELKIYPLTDNITRFRKLKKVFIDDEEKDIVWCKFQVDKVILKIEGIDTIEEAIKYKHKFLEIRRLDAIQLSEGSYFISDIIGCNVTDSSGIEIGTVIDVLKTGSNDVYHVKGAKEVLVPALKSIVEKIDITNKIMIIKPIDVWNYED